MKDISVETYLLSVPERFSEAFTLIRETILDHLPEG